ncbi:MAG TPA: CHAD domain-containing protein [Nocardioides sp.]|nr:CHAD domain-containing protein [Nocardioides sp.]
MGRFTIGDCLQGYLAHQVVEVRRLGERRYADGRLDGDGSEDVHDLRVALRRIHSTLSAGAPAYEKKAVAPLRTAVRELIGVLGVPRDLEVLSGLLLPRIEDPADRVLVRDVLAGRHQRAEAAALAALGPSALEALDRSLDHLLAAPPTSARADRSARKEAPRLVRREVRRLARLADHAHRTPTDAERWEALHDLRKATKRTRYLLEATKEARAGHRGARIKELTALQDVLGDQHDLVVAARVARELGAAEPAGLVTLADTIETEAESLVPAYLQAWGRVRDRAVAAGWLG